MARKTKKTAARTARASRMEPEPEAGMVRRVMGQPMKRPSTIRFDYIKSPLHRVIYVDGFHGGLTPSGKVHMALFNERKPIARSETYRLTPGAALDKLESRIERDAMIREVEASVVMDLERAVALRGWLDRLFKQIEELQAKAKIKRKGS
jgi:hypothetical protein